jgi:hypothetical protein
MISHWQPSCSENCSPFHLAARQSSFRPRFFGDQRIPPPSKFTSPPFRFPPHFPLLHFVQSAYALGALFKTIPDRSEVTLSLESDDGAASLVECEPMEQRPSTRSSARIRRNGGSPCLGQQEVPLTCFSGWRVSKPYPAMGVHPGLYMEVTHEEGKIVQGLVRHGGSNHSVMEALDRKR